MSEPPQFSDEVTDEVRAVHQKAFDDAASILEAEIRGIAGEGQTIVVLTGFKNKFDAWEDGQIDGPVPPLATIENLRSEFKYFVVEKEAWMQTPEYNKQLEQICYSHMGGGTSLSYKFFSVFKKSLAAVRSSLRSRAHEKALCLAIKLTKAMVENDEWYCDTDVPEEAVKIVKELGNIWSTILSAFAESRCSVVLVEWLGEVQADWQCAASEQLGSKLTFAFAEKPPRTPMKSRKSSSSAEQSTGKKRKADLDGPSEKHAKKSRVAPISADVEAWLHRLDGQLHQRQASCAQLHCESGAQKRVLVVSGAYPLRAVGFAIAEAFGKAADDFDPHPNKGKSPPGLGFFLERDGARHALKPALKIVQAVQTSGDSVVVEMDGLSVKTTLDVIKLKTDAGFNYIKDRPLPRCVGGDKGFGPQLLKRLNRTFLCDRKPIDFIGCSRKEAINGTLEDMAKPIALRRGEVVIEGFGLGFYEEPGAIPSHELHPLFI